MRTAICKRLGCEVPIFAFSHCRDVVVALTKAGGAVGGEVVNALGGGTAAVMKQIIGNALRPQVRKAA